MTASTPMSVFHQWLLADPASQTSACAIIIHGEASSSRLILDISEYLNEYDDDGDGRWLPATTELVGKIAVDANHRRLLGLAENGSSSPAEFARTLTALGRRGHVVFRSPGIDDDDLGLDNTFHAGVGRDIPERCHVILDPELMDPRCIAHVIGDVFLEWLHGENRGKSPIRDIR